MKRCIEQRSLAYQRCIILDSAGILIHCADIMIQLKTTREYSLVVLSCSCRSSSWATGWREESSDPSRCWSWVSGWRTSRCEIELNVSLLCGIRLTEWKGYPCRPVRRLER